MTASMNREQTLREAAREASDWLLHCLLPFWAERGCYPSGGFVERIGREGPVDLPLRCRVACRQIYLFCTAGKLGWAGPWRTIVDDALPFFLDAYRREDGLLRTLVSSSGDALDERADNYDQAFGLFALAHAYEATNNAAIRSRALGMVDRLWEMRAHPLGGLWEGESGQVPLRSNPHMHLLEAMLAWMERDPSDLFRQKASEIAALAATRFIDRETGALHEHFDAHWQPMEDISGRIVEPGHQFEWAWLLNKWIRLGGALDPAIPARLYRRGLDHGIDHRRNVAINQIDRHGAILDGAARLWPQTERLKAALCLGSEGEAVAAWQGLKTYADPDHPGLFFDICQVDGSFVPGPALASSLYHIACAISELVQHADAHEVTPS